MGIRCLLGLWGVLMLGLLRHARGRGQLGRLLARVDGGRVVLLLLLLLELLVACGRRHLSGGRVARTLARGWMVHGRVVDGCS